MSWLKPKATVTVTHELTADTKDYIDEKVDALKHMLREVGIFLAVAVPTVIVLGFAARVGADAIQSTIDPNN
jgi:hypothetical protein